MERWEGWIRGRQGRRLGTAVLLGLFAQAPSQAGPLEPRTADVTARGTAPAPSLVATETRLWVGLKNRNDQGTRFDVRAELYVNDKRVAEGETRCVAGLARNAFKAREVPISFGPLTNGDIVRGDVFALKVLTRIGTNSNGARCGGPRDAGGLRLFYDGVGRPSRLGVTVVPETSTGYFLRSTHDGFGLDTASPTRTLARKADSGPVHFDGGNPWVEVGTWKREVVVPAARLFSGSGPGGPIVDGVGSGTAGAPLRSRVTVPMDFAGPLSNVWVEFNGLDHGHVGDLRVRLIHPDGTTSMDLLSRPGRGADDFGYSSLFYGFGSDFVADRTYSFSDNGTVVFLPHPAGGPPDGWQRGPLMPAGIYRPSSNVNPPDLTTHEYRYTPSSFAATFGGMSAVGAWTLEIVDWAAELTGSLGGWTLNICSGGCPAAPTRLGDELFKLTAFDPDMGGEFGHSMAFSGHTAIVGSPSYSGANFFDAGSAYLFDVTTGRQLALLAPSHDRADFAYFGYSVAIGGHTALVGALSDRRDVVGMGFATGSVYVFDVSDPTHPIERLKLIPSDATGDILWQFGGSIALSGNLAVVGAPKWAPTSPATGTVYLFDVTTGQELAKFSASDAALGDRFGAAVAISGHTVVVGAPYKDSDTGAAYVIDVSDPRHPIERFKLAVSDAGVGPRFGDSVAVSGNRVLVGAPQIQDGDFFSGAAYLFDVNTGQQQARLTAASLPQTHLNFGYSVALDGDTALVGAPSADGDTSPASGSVYLFDVSDPLHPAELRSLTASDAEDTDWYGWSVALSGETALVGATQFLTSAGKAFVYRGPAAP